MQTTFINTQLAETNNDLSDCIKCALDKVNTPGQIEIKGNLNQGPDIISVLNNTALVVYGEVSYDNNSCKIVAKLISKINPGRLSMVGRPPAWSHNE